MEDAGEDSLLPEEPAPDGVDAWRPVWEDEAKADATLVPPWVTQKQARALRHHVPHAATPLGSLAAAEDALSRLDAGAEAASDAVREGLVARLAFAEAGDWLAAAADRTWVHPRDLALAEAGLLGGFSAAALSGRPARALPATSAALGGPGQAGTAVLAAEADRLPDGPVLAQGLALARALRRLASTGWDPLASAEAATVALAPLAATQDGVVRPCVHPERFLAWQRGALGTARDAGAAGRPVLLAAAAAAADWLDAGALEDAVPTSAQALLLAAAVARRRGRVRAVFLPFWGAGPGVRTMGLPLRDPAAWPGAFLARVALAARHGLAELARLRDAAAAAARLAGSGRRSLLPAAAEAALRAPAVTAQGLARQLGVTPQGALGLLRRLEAAGVVREATGRRSFRAWAA